jgi:hypothetical protein
VSTATAVPSIEEFPTLGDQASNRSNNRGGAWSNDPRGVYSKDEFPALGAAAASSQTFGNQSGRGSWMNSSAQSNATTNSNVKSKKITPPVNTVTNGLSNINIQEDFPALRGARKTTIVAMSNANFSAWSNTKKSANGK